MLEVCLCKLAIYKLKILGRGKFEYYKSMGGTTKRGGGNKFLKFSGGGEGWGAKGGNTILDFSTFGHKTFGTQIQFFSACLYCQKQLKMKILIGNGIILILKSILLEHCTCKKVLKQSIFF